MSYWLLITTILGCGGGGVWGGGVGCGVGVWGCGGGGGGGINSVITQLHHIIANLH